MALEYKNAPCPFDQENHLPLAGAAPAKAGKPFGKTRDPNLRALLGDRNTNANANADCKGSGTRHTDHDRDRRELGQYMEMKEAMLYRSEARQHEHAQAKRAADDAAGADAAARLHASEMQDAARHERQLKADAKLARETYDDLAAESKEAKRSEEAANRDACAKLVAEIDAELAAEKAAAQAQRDAEHDAERAAELAAAEEEAYNAWVKQRKQQLEDDEEAAGQLVAADVWEMVMEKVEAERQEELDEAASLELVERLAREEKAEAALAASRLAKSDEKLASKLAQALSRDEFRARMRDEAASTKATFELQAAESKGCGGPPATAREVATAAWSKAALQIDDVAGGICMSVYLPDLIDLRVTTEPKTHTVALRAKRMPFPDDGSGSSKAAEQLKFKLDIKIDSSSNNDAFSESVKHEYSSEDGMVHIFLDSVKLITERGTLKSDPAKSSQPKGATGLAARMGRRLGSFFRSGDTVGI